MNRAAPTFRMERGSAPLLVSLPHCGTAVPEAMLERMVERARQLEDTDWHLPELYSFARETGANLIVPLHSRYVIDLNRPPDDAPMYTGVNSTGLCPRQFFSGELLYRPGMEPDAAEVRQRCERYWQPYHEALRSELERLRAEHGLALLLDGHSIKSELPWLFDGKLPDLNLGTAGGATCAPSLRDALARTLAAQSDFTHVVDGRFRGGYIVRRYGQPVHGVHAAQLEMCWSCYMPETPPYRVDPQRAARLVPVLESIVQSMLQWRNHPA